MGGTACQSILSAAVIMAVSPTAAGAQAQSRRQALGWSTGALDLVSGHD